MKVVIPGGTGQVGTVLARAFDRGGHEVVLISRQAEGDPGGQSSGTGRATVNGTPRSTARMWSSTWPVEASTADTTSETAKRSSNLES